MPAKSNNAAAGPAKKKEAAAAAATAPVTEGAAVPVKKEISKKIAKPSASTSSKGREPLGKPGLRRLARRGGVKRIQTNVYPGVQQLTQAFLEKTIQDAMKYTKHANRKTIYANDILEALRRRGQTLYGF